MTERPILFKGEMVRAILGGSKTQTRRIVTDESLITLRPDGTPGKVQQRCKFGQPGDRLWVREAFLVQPDLWAAGHGPQPVHYTVDVADAGQVEDYIGKPSIHMPRWASRITLEITAVRVDRLQEISEVDAKAEGIEPTMPNPGHWNWRDYLIDGGQTHAVLSYKTLWESINGPGSWDANPWVWVVEFKKVAS